MNRLAVLATALTACVPDGSERAPLVEQDALIDMVGTWRWVHRGEQDGAISVEDEEWRIHMTPGAHLAGHYLRTVDVRTTDGLGFPCNQRLTYRQRALIDVVIDTDGAGGFGARETTYDAEPSPCDHGFRHLASYTLVPRGTRMELTWDGGSQTLWHVDADGTELAKPWSEPPAVPTGAWRWQARSYDDDGNIRDEAEWWELARRSDARIDATYRRRVTVTSPDGTPIACAGAPRWSFDDAYVLTGERDEEHWHFIERAVDAGTHPCLAPTPERNLDEATAEQVGAYLVLEWRGKRRQVLYRAEGR